MKFSISPAVFEKLPTACFGVVAVLDAVPSPEADAAIAARLAEAVTDCQAALAGVASRNPRRSCPIGRPSVPWDRTPTNTLVPLKPCSPGLPRAKVCPPSIRWWIWAMRYRCGTVCPSAP